MRKIAVLIFVISLLVCFAQAQRRQGERPGERRRGKGEGGGLERPLPPRRGPRQEKDLRDQQQQQPEETGNNQNATIRNQPKPEKKPHQGEHSKEQKEEREGRQLVKLIFVLVGAILLVALILLLKLINRTDQQARQNAENTPTIILPTKKAPQVQLEEEIKAHKKRLRQLQMLKRIKAKYLVNSASSQMQLAREEQFCKNHEEDLKTPSFTNPFTFRSTV